MAKFLFTLILAVMTSPCINDDSTCPKKDVPEPKKQCNALLGYFQRHTDLDCNELVPPSEGDLMSTRPRITIRITDDMKIDPPIPILVFMFDPDAEVGEPDQGYVHWIAKAMLYKTGLVDDISDAVGGEYIAPSPPSGDEHRYQLFVFQFPGDKKVAPNPHGQLSRRNTLRTFMDDNELGCPIASTQFRYEAE